MTDNVTNELTYELLKEIRATQKGQSEQFHIIKEEIRAIRTHMAGFQADIANLYTETGTIQKELVRVRRRLNLVEEPG